MKQWRIYQCIHNDTQKNLNCIKTQQNEFFNSSNNNKEEDKNTEKVQDDSSGLPEEQPENNPDNDADMSTPPLPEFLSDSKDEDLIQGALTNKDNPNGLKKPSPTRRHSKRLQQITPEQNKEHKQKSFKLNNTGATDPLKNKDE